MTFFVRKVVYALLLFELIAFLIIYYAGPVGISSCRLMQDQIDAVQGSIRSIELEISEIMDDIVRSKTDFMQEKIAREVLQMKKSNEMVYLVDKELL